MTDRASSRTIEAEQYANWLVKRWGEPWSPAQRRAIIEAITAAVKAERRYIAQMVMTWIGSIPDDEHRIREEIAQAIRNRGNE